MGRRCIGLDVHREFAQIAVWEAGRVRQAGQIALTAEALRVFVDSLGPEDEVAIEATCNTHAIVRLIEPRVKRVVVSNPQKTRAIAEAKVKTDKVDAQVLCQLLAADYLPSVWVADQATQALRRQVARRAHIVRQRTRLKNQVQSILHRNLIPRCPAADLFGIKGRVWLGRQPLPPDEELAVQALLRQLDFHAQELRIIDAELGRIALARGEVKRLMTIPGVDATIALSIVAAVGEFRRFRCPEQLVSYLGLNPRVKQSGGQPASHGRITKQGRAHARGMLVEAACGRGQDPGSAAGVLRARPLAARDADRGRRDRPQARVPVLDDDRTWRGLRVCEAVADREEAPQARAPRRDAIAPRAQRQVRRVQPQGSPAARAGARRAGRTLIPPARRRLASQRASEEVGRGRRQWDATSRALCGASCAAGLSPRTCASLRGRPRPRPSVALADNPHAANDAAQRRGSRTPTHVLLSEHPRPWRVSPASVPASDDLTQAATNP
jgi:transposase